MRYFTSDWHFGHERVLEFSKRIFDNIDAHDSAIICLLNRRVQRKDTLYVLGDISFVPNFGKYRHRIYCKNIHYIRGNHDRAKYDKYFTTAQDTKMITLEGNHPCFMSHYPHIFWPSSHYGSLHLYGHMHDQREKWLDDLIPDRRSTDVGVDTAKRILGDYYPFSEPEILNLLLPKAGHDPVEWYRNR